MKFLKPSELPEDTVIELPDDHAPERYIKVNMANEGQTPDYWWEPFACGNCGWGSSIKDSEADERIKAYRIVSLPYRVTADLVASSSKGSGVPVDVSIAFMLKEAHSDGLV